MNSVIKPWRDYRAEGIRYVLIQFTDLYGDARGKLVPVEHFDDLFDRGAGFAGSSVWGLGLPRHGERSEFYAVADDSTVRRLPWMPDTLHLIGNGHVAREPFVGCPRQTLMRAQAALAKQGFTMNVGIEPEFFLFKRDAAAPHTLADLDDHLDKPSYDLHTLLREPYLGTLKALSQWLQAMDFDVLQIDHEDAPGQFEVNYRYGELLRAADDFTRFKLAAEAAAEARGLTYSGTAKPFADRPGSGLHFHISFADRDRDGKAAFSHDGVTLSPTGQHALAGLLAHATALTALCAPTINSYQRLSAQDSRSGTTWAPGVIAWGDNNRTVPARVVDGRIEWRVPDPSCNVYLALAGVAHAMLDGIEQRLPLDAAVNVDAYEIDQALARLPASLSAAKAALRADQALSAAIGGHIVEQFLRLPER